MSTKTEPDLRLTGGGRSAEELSPQQAKIAAEALETDPDALRVDPQSGELLRDGQKTGKTLTEITEEYEFGKIISGPRQLTMNVGGAAPRYSDLTVKKWDHGLDGAFQRKDRVHLVVTAQVDAVAFAGVKDSAGKEIGVCRSHVAEVIGPSVFQITEDEIALLRKMRAERNGSGE